MKRQELSRTKVLDKIKEAGDRPYMVTFRKKNGLKRKMRAKQGVTLGQKGGKDNVMKESNGYLTTFDTDEAGYRTINLDTITKLKVNGVKYKVI